MHHIQVCTYSWSEFNLEMRCKECEKSQLLMNPTVSESWALIGCNCGLIFIVTHVLYACVTPSKCNHCPVTLWRHFGVQKFMSFRIFLKWVIQFLHLLLVTHAKKRCHSFRKACTVIKSRAVGREVSKYTEPVILVINIETFRDWLASKNAAVE